MLRKVKHCYYHAKKTQHSGVCRGGQSGNALGNKCEIGEGCYGMYGAEVYIKRMLIFISGVILF